MARPKASSKKSIEHQLIMPVLPLRDVVVYPYMVIPLFVGRRPSILALEAAMESGKQIFLVAQREVSDDEPNDKDLYKVGTVSTVLQLLKLPDGTIKILVEGESCARVKSYGQEDEYLLANLELIEDTDSGREEIPPLIKALYSQFEQYVKLDRRIPIEILSSLLSIEEPGRLADTIAIHLPLRLPQKQQILETQDVQARIELIMMMLEVEIDSINVEKRIHARVENQMKKSQREFYLNEKMKAIQKELLGSGAEGVSPVNEFEQLKDRIEKAGMPLDAKKKALAELTKLKMMPAMSAEATVLRNYLDWLLEVPWKAESKVRRDLTKAEQVLEAEHYGLEKVKERIIEHLAVQQRVRKIKGPILCLVGPPGVGKTSLGQSIANATGRKFVRISLGGVRDEAEIRGHRRTYIGALPGKIIQKLAKVKVKNPLFMLDEVDKMAMDFRGDPASALLEVLDPEQNNTFNDHYLELDYDLSSVMFIATANSLNIPAPLLDRMEIIRIPGYTESEKLNIATRYLIPRQIEQNGLKSTEIKFSEAAVLEIIQYYTREAGVRNLDREISKICRKVVKEILLDKSAKKHKHIISQLDIEKYLGVKRYRYGLVEDHDQIGQVRGLAWTEVGGELLTIEAVIVPGKGRSVCTGQLGDVMQESIQAAMTVVHSRAKSLGIREDVYRNRDVHVHVPEGATPKDGPSAGIAMCTALVSAFTGIPVRADVAMTGEITLRGEVLPIGGLKEKLLAAQRGGIKTVILSEENKKDLTEVPKEILQGLTIRRVKWIDQVLEIALAHMPVPLLQDDSLEDKCSDDADIPPLPRRKKVKPVHPDTH